MDNTVALYRYDDYGAYFSQGRKLVYSLQFLDSFSSSPETNSDLIYRSEGCYSDPCLYPGLDYFVEAFDAHTYSDWINNRKLGYFRRPLSLELYVSFCWPLCLYCHSNQIFSPDKDSIETYVDYLLRNIRLQGQLFSGDTKIEQIYFRGGTTFLSDTQLRALTEEIKQYFNLIEGGDFCIEIAARPLTNCSMQVLNKIGFNSAVVGIHDLDQQTNHSKQRIQSEETIVQAICDIRRAGFNSVRVELNYGLPRQNLDETANSLLKLLQPTQIRLGFRIINNVQEYLGYKGIVVLQNHLKQKPSLK